LGFHERGWVRQLEGVRPAIKGAFALVLVVGVGALDFVTGYELAFSIFYLLPISFATWFTTRGFGLVVSTASAVVWAWADVASGHVFATPLIPLWSSAIRWSFFVLVTVLLSEVHASWLRERALARTDALTGAVNKRRFEELAQWELDRLARYGRAFSLVYLDLDHFKALNDRHGHAAGDEALRVVVQHAQTHLRRTDVVARLGGDELALLLPETDAEAALGLVPKVRAGVLAEMRARDWPVTLSAGVVTCRAPLASVAALLEAADQLMYAVKRRGRDAVEHRVVEAPVTDVGSAE
jgi:diguanylate cyclase (GGDEF)-like protein